MPQFIYPSPTERHLGYFQVLAIMTKVVINICLQVFLRNSHLFFLQFLYVCWYSHFVHALFSCFLLDVCDMFELTGPLYDSYFEFFVE